MVACGAAGGSRTGAVASSGTGSGLRYLARVLAASAGQRAEQANGSRTCRLSLIRDRRPHHSRDHAAIAARRTAWDPPWRQGGSSPPAPARAPLPAATSARCRPSLDPSLCPLRLRPGGSARRISASALRCHRKSLGVAGMITARLAPGVPAAVPDPQGRPSSPPPVPCASAPRPASPAPHVVVDAEAYTPLMHGVTCPGHYGRLP